MAAKYLGLALLCAAAVSAAEPEVFADIVCDPDTTGYSNFNPIGTCACTDHLYVGKDCSEGYICLDTSGRGCYKV